MSLPSPPHRADRRVLAEEITAICDQIDRRLGSPPGTAEAGVYFWYWPPGGQSTELLTRLHADAVAYLHTLTGGRRVTIVGLLHAVGAPACPARCRGGPTCSMSQSRVSRLNA